ncbi:carbohydrate ABC transporter membrane protein 1 (CUT1 family) [Litoreibacter meonggei]|uniref:Carbohydrate ABC transporter membrane protein 1 (CUT1 family) n=1 Tax=Litoreibacter meonggei TaxID=1049199 RepID=A0A497X4J8_9RHOB|nr:sugar ABC transporter permease [Litoreibacter meonggei]RLJ60122.1 carbohydrate ABC transporter membrane protein 1 (CUT1 family) [Litoreibacter meonggei]
MRNHYNGAWLLVLPAGLLLAVLGVVPLIAVLNYSFFDIFTLQDRFWVGAEWYQDLVGSPDLYRALARSVLFTTLVVLIQFPLGIGIALLLPKGTNTSSFFLMVMAVPLVVPWNMIPIIWLNLLSQDLGFLGQFLTWMDWSFDYKFNAIHTWAFLLIIDTWHWIGLVAILAYSGLSSIPAPYMQAAAIDGATRWSTFRYIQLPKLRGVMMMALLLRVMDSLMIYTEAFAINAGGPNNATSFLSLELGEQISAFDYGPAAARSALYFLLVLFIAWLFQLSLRRNDTAKENGL